MYLMTQNKKTYDLLYFKEIIDNHNIELKSISNEFVDNEDLYDENEFEKRDVLKVSRGTIKQDELFEYADIPDYYISNRIKDF